MFFLFLHKTEIVGTRGGSNEYPQSMFWSKNKNRYTPHKLGMDNIDPQNCLEWRGHLGRRLVKQVQPSVEDNKL